MLFRSLLTLFAVLLVNLSSSLGQDLASYRIYEALPGERLSVQVESAEYPTVIRTAKNGSVAKYKFNFEEQYRIRYQSHEDFHGLDTVIVLAFQQVTASTRRPQLEGLVVQVKSVIAEDDYYLQPEGRSAMILDVMANDRSSSESWISDIVYVSSGAATISDDQTQIRWSSGDDPVAYVIYRICNGVECAEARVKIKRDQDRPSADEIFIDAHKNDVVTFQVPTAFVPPASHSINGTLRQVRTGVWEFDPDEAFVGKDVARFYQIYEGNLINFVVNLRYSDPSDENGWCADDVFYTELENELIFSVVENDVFGNVSQILSSDLEGSLSAIANGTYRFKPNPGFNGQTSFDYVSCKDYRCDTATVTLVVHNYPPLKDEWHLIGDKNLSLDLPYDVPIDQFEFKIDQSPQHGSLSLDSDGQSLLYVPLDDFVGFDFALIQYCTDNAGSSNCEPLAIYFEIQDRARLDNCYEQCVYPGDLNDDGIVTVSDVLPLGINLGTSGTARADRSITDWYGRASSPWIGDIPVGAQNLNSVDADGNGAIEVDDLEAMTLHYGKAHRLVPTPPPLVADVPIRLELTDPALVAGEEAVIDVFVGSASHEVQDMLGFNFSAIINGQVVDSSSLRFDIVPGGLVGTEDGILAYSYSPLDGQLDVGFSKFDGREIEGHGVLGQIRFIVEEDLNGFRRLPDLDFDVLIDDVNCLGSDGNYMALPSASIRTNLQRSVQPLQIAVYPSPANQYLDIRAPYSINSYRLIDALGSTILDGNDIGTSKRLSLDQVPSGVYFLHLRTSKEDFVTKVQVTK